MRPESPPPASLPRPERHAWMLRTLRAAVGRACASDRAAQREDLVQAALVRVLEREEQGEQNQVRTASYLWRVAFSVIADERRRRDRAASGCRSGHRQRDLAVSGCRLPDYPD